MGVKVRKYCSSLLTHCDHQWIILLVHHEAVQDIARPVPEGNGSPYVQLATCCLWFSNYAVHLDMRSIGGKVRSRVQSTQSGLQSTRQAGKVWWHHVY